MLEQILTDGARELGVALPEGALRAFRAYYELLAARNAVMDLTAVAGEDETARRHFLDSAAVSRYADFAGAEAVDVGSGAGFPGLPIQILVPSCRFTLLDAQQKRVDFLREAAAVCGAPAVCVQARAEEAAAALRERFDIAVSRAVARLNVLCELCLPLVKPGGVLIAMKGSAAPEEIGEARNAIAVLGGRLLRTEAYTIPGETIPRTAVIVAKTGTTPPIYPRRYARIQKKPL